MLLELGLVVVVPREEVGFEFDPLDEIAFEEAHTLFEQRAADLEWSPAHVAKVHFHSDALRESLGEEQLVAQAEPAAFAIAAQVVPHIEV